MWIILSTSWESYEVVGTKCLEQCLSHRRCYNSVCCYLYCYSFHLAKVRALLARAPLPFQASKSKPILVWNQYCRFQNFRASLCTSIPSSFKMSFLKQGSETQLFRKAGERGLGFRNNEVSSLFLFPISEWCSARHHAVISPPHTLLCSWQDILDLVKKLWCKEQDLPSVTIHPQGMSS